MKLYHLGIGKGDLPPYVLLPGTRKRVEAIASLLGGDIIDRGRQLVAVGSYEGVEVAAVDTGMGPSSAAIVVREVIEAVDDRAVLVRVGTAGSLQERVKVGDLVVSTGVIVDECVSKRIAGDIPLIPSREVVDSLVASAEGMGYVLGENLHVGLTHSKDALYEFEDPELSSDPESGRRRLDYLIRIGALATEMELSVILALAARYGTEGRDIRAGGVFLVVSPFIKKGLRFEAPTQRDLIEVALRAIVKLAKADKMVRG